MYEGVNVQNAAAYTISMDTMLTETHMGLLREAVELAYGRSLADIDKFKCLAGDYFTHTSPLWNFLDAPFTVIPMNLNMMANMLRIPEYNSGSDNASEILEDCRQVLRAEDLSDMARWMFKGKDPVWKAASPFLEHLFKDRYHLLGIERYNELLVPDACVLARWRLMIEI